MKALIELIQIKEYMEGDRTVFTCPQIKEIRLLLGTKEIGQDLALYLLFFAWEAPLILFIHLYKKRKKKKRLLRGISTTL